MGKKHSVLRIFCLFLLSAGISLAVFSVDYINRTAKEIECSKPVYLKRTGTQWEKQGRIIGEMAYPPKAFTIDVYASGLNEKPLKTISPNVNLSVYDAGWFGPGTYDLIIKAGGYVDQPARGIKIIPYNDCVINIIFGQIEYKRK